MKVLPEVSLGIPPARVSTSGGNKINVLRYFNFLYSFKFEAQPKPTATWFVKGDQEISISVGPEEQRLQNYVVFPLEKVIILFYVSN